MQVRPPGSGKTPAKQRPRPDVGNVVIFEPGRTELLGDVLGTVDGYEARLPASQRIQGEAVERVHAVVTVVVAGELIVSRRSPLLIAGLFARFEAIANRSVTIWHVVREPGVRAKVGLTTSDEALLDEPNFIERLFCADNGAIIKTIVADSGDPMIDMVPSELDIASYACGALAPTEITHLQIDQDREELRLAIPDEAELAIDGVHLQLASDLVGWDLTVLRGSHHARDGWDAAPVRCVRPRAPAPRVD